MYEIRRTSNFARSYKKLTHSGLLKETAIKDLAFAIDTIATGISLPAKYKDHPLKGELQGYRECHIKGDLLLVYQRNKDRLILVLIDVGTHASLFG